VSVDAGLATFHSVFGERVARLEPDGRITRLGLFESEAGACPGDRLVMKGGSADSRSEPIGGAAVVIPGSPPATYTFTDSCSTCEAALGAYALHVLDEEAQLRQAAHRSELEQRLELEGQRSAFR
jgi:hypothetical protein